jgi:hypothetical protein
MLFLVLCCDVSWVRFEQCCMDGHVSVGDRIVAVQGVVLLDANGMCNDQGAALRAALRTAVREEVLCKMEGHAR